jgi:hypothetical protein
MITGGTRVLWIAFATAAVPFHSWDGEWRWTGLPELPADARKYFRRAVEGHQQVRFGPLGVNMVVTRR